MTTMKTLIALFALSATPALAATGPFFSLRNTDFVVMLGFLAFLGVVLYLKVPALIGGLLDKRAEGIKADLDAAKALHDEAKAVLAQYDAKKREMQEQADLIVANAKREAQAAADQAKADLKASIARRLASAEDQIASAEASAVRDVRDRAVNVAVAAAGDILAVQMDKTQKGGLVDAAIAVVEAKLH